MSGDADTAAAQPGVLGGSDAAMSGRLPVMVVLGVCALLAAYMYWLPMNIMYYTWTAPDSLYGHGFFVPPICLYFVWRKRAQLRESGLNGSAWGLLVVAVALLLHLSIGNFLGFSVMSQLSFVLLLTGMVMVFLGITGVKLLAFPLAYLLFMVPIPSSITSSVALKMKLFAAECAVFLCNLLTIPMVRKGSFIHFNETDRLIVGEVCGGMRSLIALLAIGAIMAYISKSTNTGKLLILLMSPPIAIVANVFRIFLLCVVGYFFGSATAAGAVHDWSGYGIYAVAIVLFLGLESRLVRWFPERELAAVNTDEPVSPPSSPPARRQLPVYAGAALLMTCAAGVHFLFASAQASAEPKPVTDVLNVPTYVGGYSQVGPDEEVSEAVKRALETSTILIRNYESYTGWPVQLSIVYAGTTRRSLHFPEVCLVGAGMEIRQQYETRVGFGFTAKRLVLIEGQQEWAVLYFFKTGDKFTGNFFVNSWEWAKNQITFGAKTSAMIKLMTPVTPRGEDESFAVLDDFAQKLAPILLERVE